MLLLEKYFALLSMLMVPVLYIITCSLFYLLLYKWKPQTFQAKKIQTQSLAPAQLRREISYTIISLLIFCVMGFVVYLLQRKGLSRLYFKLSDYGITYFIISILLMTLLHDTYFYWTHRLLHLRGWYGKIHIVHHLSSNPSPFTALSFHPVESFIQAGITPLIVLIIPSHPIALSVFAVHDNKKCTRALGLRVNWELFYKQ
jgi:sterol desaturase/sphingolipid hydroxylase (fatty acid hydroxylase superfamily)